jgi:hypothetical protein
MTYGIAKLSDHRDFLEDCAEVSSYQSIAWTDKALAIFNASEPERDLDADMSYVTFSYRGAPVFPAGVLGGFATRGEAEATANSWAPYWN